MKKDKKKQIVEKKDIKVLNSSNVLSPLTFIKGILIVFLFLRPFFDGFAYPGFNHMFSISIFVLLTISIFINRKTLIFSPGQFFFFIFIIYCFAGLLFFWNLWYVVIKECSYLLTLFAIWVLFKTNFSEKDFKIVSFISILALGLIAAYGIYQYFWGLEITRQTIMQHPEMIKNMPETYIDRMASNRIFSTFVYPNTFAGYLLMLYPVVFFSILSSSSLPLKIFNGIVLAAILPVFAATESMGGWFCFLLISFLMLLFFIVPGKLYLQTCAIVFIVSTFMVIAGIKYGFLPKISSLTDRMNYWSSAISVFKNHYLTGIGPGNFSQFYLKFKIPGAMEAKYAHNLFFEIISCTGIIGCIIFLLACFYFVKRNINNFLYSKEPLFAGFTFATIATFLHFMVDFHYQNAAITVILFAFVGLIESHPVITDQPLRKLTKLLAGSMIFLSFISGVVEFKSWRVEKIIGDIEEGKYRDNPIQALEYAGNIFPEPEAFFMQGQIFKFAYFQTKNIEFAEKAIDGYKKAVTMNPFSARYHRALAEMLEAIGRFEEAEKEFVQMIECYPSKSLYNLEIGLFYKKIGKDELAKIYIERSEKLPPSSKDEVRIIEEYKNGKNL